MTYYMKTQINIDRYDVIIYQDEKIIYNAKMLITVEKEFIRSAVYLANRLDFDGARMEYVLRSLALTDEILNRYTKSDD